MDVALYGMLIVVIIFGFFASMMEVAQVVWAKRFQMQIRQGIAGAEMTYADLQHMAARWRQDRGVVLQSLRSVFSDTFAESGQGNEAARSYIRELIAAHQAEEPFAELPQNTGLQLVAMQAALVSTLSAVPQLAESLGELYSKNRRELAQKKKLSYLGFAVGVAGLVVGLQPLVFSG